MVNKFEISGRINFIDKILDPNTNKHKVVKIGLGNKAPKIEKYNNVVIAFFNNDKKELAEEILQKFNEQDYIEVAGSISTSKYLKDGQSKPTEVINFIGHSYKKLMWDKELNNFIHVA